VELGTVDLLTTDWKDIKSPNNSHIFWLVFGEENSEMFEEATKTIVEDINTILLNYF